jgi:prepilin-type N-terminal cleavage/methylation domain-containing protein
MTKRKNGFTLIELIFTTLIIGLLAAVAIPAFTGYKFRSQRSEGMTNVEQIVSLSLAYYGEAGNYPDVTGYWPVPVPNPLPETWDAASSAEFSEIGFRMDGDVRYRYDIDANAECPCTQCLTVIAYSDLNGGNGFGGVGYFHRDDAGVECWTDVTAWPPPQDSSLAFVYDEAYPYPKTPGLTDDF